MHAPEARRMHERRIVSMVPALLGLAGVLALAAPTGASQYPVPYNFSAGVLAAALTPGAPPPGSNDWSCRPSAAHPEPVILVHGLAANMTDNWQTISPLLANNGYCVFALTYGTNPDFPFPLDQIGDSRRSRRARRRSATSSIRCSPRRAPPR
jgi:triacylglycerol lipase